MTTSTQWEKGPDGISCVHCGLPWDRHIVGGNRCPQIVVEGNAGSEPAEPFKSELRKAGFLPENDDG